MLVNCDLAFKICPDYLPKLCVQKISFSNVNTTKRQLCLPNMYSSSNKQEYQTTWIYPDIFKYSISIYIISIIITCITIIITTLISLRMRDSSRPIPNWSSPATLSGLRCSSLPLFDLSFQFSIFCPYFQSISHLGRDAELFWGGTTWLGCELCPLTTPLSNLITQASSLTLGER